MKRIVPALAVLAALLGPSVSAEPTIPYFWDSRERLPKPELSDFPRLRFLTTIDFPPFNFLDGSGRLTGFHVDLARAICAKIDLTDTCEIQAVPWEELPQALQAGDGEAIIAGLAMSAESRQRFAFSRPYLQLPARFVMAKGNAVEEPVYQKLVDRRVGVIDGSAHERALRDLFPGVRVVTYSRAEWMLGDLREGKTDAVFGDGMRLSFWLAGTGSQACCRFAGGPYLLPEYLGTGMAVAVDPGDDQLLAAINYALREIEADGTFAELYLRYFPLGFF
ncbi:transporter substrate-binding domain-containing protein [Aquibium sp. LZ166]|uniref:Transporter substrate-binding domain-containing protein n=1 Tax=Aquibium pacificus TaxID=3153579 RepID=A0ABV3SCA8_9HYPH